MDYRRLPEYYGMIDDAERDEEPDPEAAALAFLGRLTAQAFLGGSLALVAWFIYLVMGAIGVMMAR